MAKIFEAMQRHEGVAVKTPAVETPATPFVVKPTRTYPEHQDDEDERCKEELLAHLNRFTPMKQPMKISQKIANFFKVTKN